jgi:hypothetical protein
VSGGPAAIAAIGGGTRDDGDRAAPMRRDVAATLQPRVRAPVKIVPRPDARAGDGGERRPCAATCGRRG